MNTGKNKRLIFSHYKFGKGEWSIGVHISKDVSCDYSISEFSLNMNLIKWALAIGFRFYK